MRHQKNKNSSFGRHRGPRKALVRGLVQSLVEKERIKTTLPKAKCVRPLVEKAVTMGKRDDIHSRRLLFSRYPNKKTVDKILSVLSPRFKDRPGGYTRIIKLGFRAGDKAPLAYIEFVDYNNQIGNLKETKTESVTQMSEKKSAEKEKQQKATLEKAPRKTAGKAEKQSLKKPANKIADDKKQKKLALAKIDKKRKKSRQQEKKSRRGNRKRR